MAARDGGFQTHPENAMHKGRPKMSVSLRKIKEYSTNEIIKTFGKIVSLANDEIDDWESDPSRTVLETTLLDAMKSKNAACINLVLDRILGKVPDKMEFKDETEYDEVNIGQKIDELLKLRSKDKKPDESGQGNS